MEGQDDFWEGPLSKYRPQHSDLALLHNAHAHFKNVHPGGTGKSRVCGKSENKQLALSFALSLLLEISRASGRELLSCNYSRPVVTCMRAVVKNVKVLYIKD